MVAALFEVWKIAGWRSEWRQEPEALRSQEDQLCVSATTFWDRLFDAPGTSTLPQFFATKRHKNHIACLRAWDWTAVMAMASTISRAVQPRERSFAGLSKP